jgi:hypothetical protein
MRIFVGKERIHAFIVAGLSFELLYQIRRNGIRPYIEVQLGGHALPAFSMFEVMTSSTDMTKASIAPEKTLGMINGKVTRRKR